MGLRYANVVLIAMGSAFVLGVALTIRGLRGRRVGAEPHCRPCGYDLTGGPTRCPECGSEAVGKNVVIGVQQRFWRSAGVGLGLLFIVAAISGSALYGRAKGFN